MRKVFVAAITVLAMAASSGAAAQALLKAHGGVFPFPTLMSMIYDVIKAKGFDKANGLDLETVTYGQISGYFAGLAKGEIAMGPAGVENVQKMRDQGVKLAIVLTLTRLSAMSVVVSDPAIKSVADLKGKSLAATMGSAEYQVLSTYALKSGVNFGTDVTVVQAASPMLGAQQFKAKRVDAVMAWEPAATMILAEDPSYRIAFTGEDAWRSLGKGAGWQLVFSMREDYIATNPGAVDRVLKMFRDGAAFIHANIDEADKLVQKLPPGTLKNAVVSGRLKYDVQPAWGEERANIWDMFKLAAEAKYIDKLPDERAIWQP
jgi:ABC-type nitrate/sulfonate/bicarbonate transport system substrate-binding protein